MKIAIEINHNVIPNPEPDTACGRAESGGYTVHPAIAGPLPLVPHSPGISIPKMAPFITNKERNMIKEDRKKNQYESMFKKPDAISLAPNCKGIKMFEKVPDNPPVRRKKTIMVP